MDSTLHVVYGSVARPFMGKRKFVYEFTANFNLYKNNSSFVLLKRTINKLFFKTKLKNWVKTDFSLRFLKLMTSTDRGRGKNFFCFLEYKSKQSIYK